MPRTLPRMAGSPGCPTRGGGLCGSALPPSHPPGPRPLRGSASLFPAGPELQSPETRNCGSRVRENPPLPAGPPRSAPPRPSPVSAVRGPSPAGAEWLPRRDGAGSGASGRGFSPQVTGPRRPVQAEERGGGEQRRPEREDGGCASGRFPRPVRSRCGKGMRVASPGRAAEACRCLSPPQTPRDLGGGSERGRGWG